MTSKHHINANERDQIGVLLAAGISQRDIARKLGRSFSTINYEILHNSRNGNYQPILANYLSRERNLKAQRQHAKKDPGIFVYVIDKLRCGWSPEQIAGRLKKKNHGSTIVCPETIYQYVYCPEGQKYNLKEYLPRAHGKRKQRVGFGQWESEGGKRKRPSRRHPSR